MLSITTTTCAQSVLITRVVKPEFGFGAARLVGLSDRQTDSFDWDTNPHTPRLYYKPAPPLRLQRHNKILGFIGSHHVPVFAFVLALGTRLAGVAGLCGAGAFPKLLLVQALCATSYDLNGEVVS